VHVVANQLAFLVPLLLLHDGLIFYPLFLCFQRRLFLQQMFGILLGLYASVSMDITARRCRCADFFQLSNLFLHRIDFGADLCRLVPCFGPFSFTL